MRIAILLSVGIVETGTAQERPDTPLTEAEQKRADEALSLNEQGFRLYERGKPAEAAALIGKSLAIYQELYPASKYPQGHPELASSMNNLGGMLHASGQLNKALALFEQALAMRRRLYPKANFPNGHADISQSLNNLAEIWEGLGKHDKALPLYEESLAMRRGLYPPNKHPHGHAEIAQSLQNVGGALDALGQPEKALPYVEQALAMYRRLFPQSAHPNGHSSLAGSLNDVGIVLDSMGHAERALPYYDEALTMRLKLYPAAQFPDGHPELVQSLNNVGHIWSATGQLEKALPYFEQALAMRRKLYPPEKYPNGHPYLARSLNNLGVLLKDMNQYDRALQVLNQALAINRKIFSEAAFPNGHPELATSINNVAAVLELLGQFDRSRDLYEQALNIRHKLMPEKRFPNGHPLIAQAISNLAGVFQSMNKPEQAHPLYEQALAMNKALYPKAAYPGGHPELAISISNLGMSLKSMGRLEDSLTFFEQALEMQRKLYPPTKYPDGHPYLIRALSNLGVAYLRLGRFKDSAAICTESLGIIHKQLRRELLTSSEAAAIQRVAAMALPRNVFLSVSRAPTITDADCYKALWPLRSAATRVLEQRQANTRAGAAAAASTLNLLKGNRRRTEQLLQLQGGASIERERQLAELADERDTLERRLIGEVPALKRWRELDALGPDDLVKALPEGAAFIDLIPYTRMMPVEDDSGKPRLKYVPSYVAFVLAAGAPVRRIDLNDAKPIDTAIGEWLRKIAARADDRTAAAGVHDLVWSKIARVLPAGTRTLYFAADGDLARVPWAALPVAEGEVLLERYTIAMTLHGSMLLNHLRFSPVHRGSESLLALGDVAYDATAWPELPGSRAEIEALTALAGQPVVRLAKDKATVRALSIELSKVRYAHLATHGEFRADALAFEKRQAQIALASDYLNPDTRRVAAKNPLGYVGLVLSGGEIFSGLSIVDLNLENLKLVTLSACETGLGESTGGEGVQGLQRAFHLAGCPNVVASLWKVSDAATAALMAKFYHEMWMNKKEPIAALREAQLFVYYHPEKIPDVLGERGAPKRAEALAINSARPQVGSKRTHTKLWAAFVLSGVGK